MSAAPAPIIVDGEPVRSCLMFAVQADGTQNSDRRRSGEWREAASAMQQAFMDHHALQCGFCTPGF